MFEQIQPTGASPARGKVRFTAVGGPTVQVELGGLSLLTDPTFDEPRRYRCPAGHLIVKTDGPALEPRDLGPVDVVLLSHDQHPDNLDHSGRKYLKSVPLVLTTPSGAQRLAGGVQGLAPWEEIVLPRPDGRTLTVTAVPAERGPEDAGDFGEVTGFVLAAPDLPMVYLTGDNASLDVVREVAARFGPIDTVLLFAGAARRGAAGGALITLDSVQAVEAARILGARKVVPARHNCWEHVGEGEDALTTAFRRARLDERLVVLRPGQSAAV